MDEVLPSKADAGSHSPATPAAGPVAIAKISSKLLSGPVDLRLLAHSATAIRRLN
jgi:hypothetical protein